MALQVELGGMLEANDAGVEEGDVGGAPAGEVQPLLDVATCRGVQQGKVGLVDVVDGELEPERGQCVPCVDGNLVLALHLRLVQVRELGLKLGL